MATGESGYSRGGRRLSDDTTNRVVDSAQVWRVTALCMDERTRNALELFFRTTLNGDYVLAVPGEGDVCILDLDRYGGETLWAAKRKTYPMLPIVLLSVNELALDENTVLVRKPFKPQDLALALKAATSKVSNKSRQPNRSASYPAETGARQDTDDATGSTPHTYSNGRDRNLEAPAPATTRRVPRGRLPQSGGKAGFMLEGLNPKAFIGSAPDIDPADPHQLAKALYEPGEFLSGKLDYAIKLSMDAGRPTRLVLERGTITVIAGTGRAIMDLHHAHLRTLAAIPLAEDKVHYHFVDAPEYAEVLPSKIWRLEALQWLLALLASRGRVPTGRNLEARLTLKHWPNLTRLAVCPSAVRIAALLVKRPCSPMEIARILKVPQRFVFAFVAAADAIGLVDVPGEQPQVVVSRGPLHEAKTVAPVKHRGLLQRILSQLGKVSAKPQLAQ